MTTNRCIKNLLKLIALLQDNSLDECCVEEGCTKPFLGPTINCICYNTRVITLYNKKGTILSANYMDSSNVMQTSTLFRVHKVDDDCVTLRVLYRDGFNYVASGSFINVNLGCICAIQCIEDAVVSNL